VFLPEQAHGPRHDLVTQGQHGQHLQFMLAAPGAQVGRQALHLVELLEQALDVRVQRLRLQRGPQSPTHALEQREAQLQLGVLQRAADGRLGDVDHARSRADAAGEHDGVEDLDVAQAHAGLWGLCEAPAPEHRGTGLGPTAVLPPKQEVTPPAARG
jgi:hypothetical protein